MESAIIDRNDFGWNRKLAHNLSRIQILMSKGSVVFTVTLNGIENNNTMFLV